MSPRQGGDSYPSGTPPYGVPSDHAFSRAGQSPQPGQPGQQGGQPGQAEPGDEPRTETTLTTRIKINIPGSRPIPPVVVRSPLNSEETGEQPAPRRHRAESAGSPVLGVMDSGTGTVTPPELPAEWRMPETGAPAAPSPGSPATPPSEWFAPRKKQAPAPSASAPAAPAPTQPAQPSQPSPEQRYPEPQFPGQPFQEPTAGYDTQSSPWAPQPQQPESPAARAAAQPQTLAPRPVPGGARPGGLQGGLAASAPEPGSQPTMQFRTVMDQQAAAPSAPARPKRGQQTAKAPKPARSAKPSAAEQTAAMPLVPQSQQVNDGFAGGTGGAGAPPRPERSGDGSNTSESSSHGSGGGSAKPAAKRAGGGKSRKLAGYAVGTLVLVGGVAYGAGLMLNQADVPKGTTVLGYSIGGDTHDQAVTKLDSTLGAIAKHPLTVSIGGRTATLNPSVAGLTIDTGATVDKVAQHSYNPVTVIGSLFGGAKAVAPVVVIDEDKLRSALQQLSSASGAGEGSIHFTAAGKVVVTLPKAGSGLDVNAAIPLIEQAFQARAAGLEGHDAVVPLTVTTVQPKASAAAANEAASTLGAWAMKQHFKVVAGGTPVLFGKSTFSQSLSLQPDASGKFVPTFNLAKLAAAYGTAFDSVHTKSGKAVTPQEVAAALTTLLTQPGGPTSITI
ncbi:hypothetical protein ABIA32_002168 [Streptacidiphilus sp. MAP12-20]|uniref:hypothetical protein n=1 Tax=Streptacidiphilus sp. MAP12-20 TaxID=3156299 RepID=UPI003516792F